MTSRMRRLVKRDIKTRKEIISRNRRLLDSVDKNSLVAKYNEKIIAANEDAIRSLQAAL